MLDPNKHHNFHVHLITEAHRLKSLLWHFRTFSTIRKKKNDQQNLVLTNHTNI